MHVQQNSVLTKLIGVLTSWRGKEKTVDVNGCHTASAHVISFCGAEVVRLSPEVHFQSHGLLRCASDRIISFASTHSCPCSPLFETRSGLIELYTHIFYIGFR